ncbi:hypothetical protein SAMN05428962_1022 [Paenibacillus sp. BC26]|nr:hypothetical protein SAMN05428962_1022 [Paenibacillus sp. BC26]
MRVALCCAGETTRYLPPTKNAQDSRSCASYHSLAAALRQVGCEFYDIFMQGYTASVQLAGTPVLCISIAIEQEDEERRSDACCKDADRNVVRQERGAGDCIR